VQDGRAAPDVYRGTVHAFKTILRTEARAHSTPTAPLAPRLRGATQPPSAAVRRPHPRRARAHSPTPAHLKRRRANSPIAPPCPAHPLPHPQGWLGLYAGLSPALAGGTLAWGLYFACYNRAKARYASWAPQRAELPAAAHLAAAAEAGAAVSVLTNPVWVAKTRLQLQRRGRDASCGRDAPEARPYRGLAHALRRIAAEEGLRGLYRGLLPSLALVSHGALQFTAYEALKKRALAGSSAPGEGVEAPPRLRAAEAGAIGVASKLLASGATYPSQVLRARLQQRGDAGGTPAGGAGASPSQPGMLRTLRALLAREGVRGLYKGWVPNVLRVLPSSALTFLVYEKASQALERGGPWA
jgi:solute carrier family 25 folate transporter 32